MRTKKSLMDPGAIKAVIFDVDGTLYDQARLRRRMLFALLGFHALRPWRYRDLVILQKFRSEREKNAGASGDIENAQYRWCADRLGCSVQEVRSVVGEWIFERPNKFLKGCVYPGTKEFIDALRDHGIKVAIYSDYPAHDKLKAMGLYADLIVSSTDPEVDRLKPDPTGLHRAVRQFGLRVEDCLFVGDRQEMDGECAERAGMPYLIIDKKPYTDFDFYKRLKDELTFFSKEHGAIINVNAI